MKKYPAKYEHGQIKHVDEFCNEVKQSIHGGRWSNFGLLDLSNEKKMVKFIKTIHVQATHVSSSSVIIQFIITPSDKFLEEHKNLIETNIIDRNVYTPTLKNFFRFWGEASYTSSSVKERMLEDLMLEIKWRALKEINRYFDLYFSDNKLVPPSMEVYKIEQSSCIFKREESEKRNQFWDSIGMGDNLFHEISKDGYWELFSQNRNHLIDSSIKISCNSQVDRRPMFHSLDFQIVYYVQEYAKLLFPILVMREYVSDISKRIAFHQQNTFSSIKEKNPNYQGLINARYELEKNVHILKRFKNEIDDHYFERIKRETINRYEFESSGRHNFEETWTEIVIENTRHLIETTYDYSQNLSELVDDTIRLLEIKTNNSLRKTTFSLTITTVLLSIVATTIAGISLYFQLNDEAKSYIGDLLNNIKDFFI